MKRIRAKAVGLGLALLTGELRAGDEPGRPALLPPAVRAGSGSGTTNWSAIPAGDAGPVWLPPRSRSETAKKPPAPPGTAAVPAVAPAAAHEEPAPVGPRPQAESALGPLPEIPPIPEPLPAKPLPAPRPAPVTPDSWQPVPPRVPQPQAEQEPWNTAADAQNPVQPPKPDPAPVPRVQPPAGVTPPAVPETPPIPTPLPAPTPQPPAKSASDAPPRPKPQPAPPPRPVEEPSRTPAAPPKAGFYGTPPTAPAEQPELQPAPPEMMVPHGARVPGKHGTFGSPPIRISKDYPSVHEHVHERVAGGWFAGREGDLQDGRAADRLFFQAEYLLWWVQPPGHIPVLASTNAAGGFGFLNEPGSVALLGSGGFGSSARNGLRLRAGYWFDDCGNCGIDASYFFLGRRNNSTTFTSNQFPALNRPIFAPNTNQEFGEVVAFPGVSSGALTVDNTSYLWGADVNLRHALCRTCDFRAEVFAGYRFLSLGERLQVSESITALPGNAADPAGTRVFVQDSFGVRNTFNGGQLGGLVERRWGRWSADLRGSVALGNTHQELNIQGSQARLRPGMTTPDVFTGGLLAVGPNLGKFSQDRFSVVPELNANLGFWFTPTLRAYVGYNVLYWSNVVRPGDSIDRVVDLTFVPNPPPGVVASGANRPQPQFTQSSLWIHGITFGAEWRY